MSRVKSAAEAASAPETPILATFNPECLFCSRCTGSAKTGYVVLFIANRYYNNAKMAPSAGLQNRRLTGHYHRPGPKFSRDI